MKANTVKVLTIHSAKGLEANNVIVIGSKFYNLEERCISYVAATRARNWLIWTRMPTRKKKNTFTERMVLDTLPYGDGYYPCDGSCHTRCETD